MRSYGPAATKLSSDVLGDSHVLQRFTWMGLGPPLAMASLGRCFPSSMTEQGYDFVREAGRVLRTEPRIQGIIQTSRAIARSFSQSL